MKTLMSKILIATAAVLICTLYPVPCTLTYANNIRIQNATLYKGPNQPAGTIDIKFDVVWDNANSDQANGPVDENGQHYFDRAWIFVKFWDTTQMTSAQPWGHAILTTGGTLSAYNATTGVGITADGMGAFAAPGTGQTVRWNYDATLIPGASGYVLSTDTVKVRVMAIEMVRIPTGSFDIGDGIGGTESTNAFHVTNDTKLTIGATLVGSIKVDVNGYDDDQIELTGIGIDGDGGLDTDNNGTIDNAFFPTGYNAFYLMKYEVTQGQYRDFLNTLTRAQQAARVATGITAGTTSVTNRYVMNNTATAANIASADNYRNGIRCDATIHTSNPVTFYCDYDNDGSTADPATINESTDGEWIACNYMSWMDLAAFSDWAGLRPMTELELEKACRGGGVTDSVTGVRAWGNATDETATSSLTSPGTASEAPNQGNCNYSSCSPDGPYRVGSYADSSSTRQNSGASYYGVMDLSGSLWERPVTVGNGTSGTVIGGRAFAGSHGDGTLTTLASYHGNATNPDWPGYDTTYPTRGISGAVGSGSRGGTWLSGATFARASDRYFAAITSPTRYLHYGGRLARTSP